MDGGWMSERKWVGLRYRRGGEDGGEIEFLG